MAADDPDDPLSDLPKPSALDFELASAMLYRRAHTIAEDTLGTGVAPDLRTTTASSLRLVARYIDGLARRARQATW